MHIKIQGGGDGVYANSGSCSAAAMYCEHEQQELMRKGIKPENFFHQYSDYVSTHEVIDRIDRNKKHLRKEDAKFFVVTVSPSAEEQRKMGDNLEDRIDAFKNYIRNGVMSEYAKNFDRGMSVDNIMYYGYVHVDRGEKTGEQMHAHIIVSRRDMANSISLSPKSNYRSGKGVIAHGFNRDRFNKNCEKAFDLMMEYSRNIEESYEYRNAIKNGNYEDIAQVTTKEMQQKYGVITTSWDDLANAIFIKQANRETKAADFGTTSIVTPAPQTAVTETKVSEHQSTNSVVMGFAKKVWSYATGLFGKKTSITEVIPDITTVTLVKEEPEQQSTNKNKNMTIVDIYKDNIGQFVLYMEKGGKYRLFDNIDAVDAFEYEQVKKSGDSEQFNKVCIYLENKYLKDIPEKNISEMKQRRTTNQHEKVVQPERKKTADGLYLFPNNDGYSAAIIKNGKRCRFVDKIDKKDFSEFFKAKNSGNKKYFEDVSSKIAAKYFHHEIAKEIVKNFRMEYKNENVTSVRFRTNPSKKYIGISSTINNEWRPVHNISPFYVEKIYELPTNEMNSLFNLVTDMIFTGNMSVGVGCGASNSPRKRDDDEKKKKKGVGR